ncbi:unnamed protein product [Alopecurus aequalis]
MSPTSPRQPGLGAGKARQQATTPIPFKVRRDSHLIHKQVTSASSPPSSSSTNSSVSSSPGVGSQQRSAPRPKQQQQQQPVIIYTTSPKVIRTSPRDFMSIVQKLTGQESAAAAGSSAVTGGAAQDESSSSSTESCANANSHANAAPAPPPGHYMADPPQLMPPPASMDHAHFMPDISLFASAGASEHQQHLLCASRGGLYGHFQPTMVDGAANMHDAAAAAGAVYSPSMVEAMRTTFPDYRLT